MDFTSHIMKFYNFHHTNYSGYMSALPVYPYAEQSWWDPQNCLFETYWLLEYLFSDSISQQFLYIILMGNFTKFKKSTIASKSYGKNCCALDHISWSYNLLGHGIIVIFWIIIWSKHQSISNLMCIFSVYCLWKKTVSGQRLAKWYMPRNSWLIPSWQDIFDLQYDFGIRDVVRMASTGSIKPI